MPLPATSPVSGEREANPQRPTAASAPHERFAALPQREAIGKPGNPLFSPHSWNPAPQQVATTQAPAGPVAPPMPYRVAGSVSQGDVQQIVLARGDAVLNV